MRWMVLALFAVTAGACTDAMVAERAAFGRPHIIELYSGGRVAATYRSTGKVECSQGGICGWMDAATGQHVMTSGDIVIRVE